MGFGAYESVPPPPPRQTKLRGDAPDRAAWGIYVVHCTVLSVWQAYSHLSLSVILPEQRVAIATLMEKTRTEPTSSLCEERGGAGVSPLKLGVTGTEQRRDVNTQTKD